MGKEITDIYLFFQMNYKKNKSETNDKELG